ncbi:hypothetical protein E8E15_010658 [Penicillium rubens]|uniref:Uncharacterized protein n=1 Tax=Penicillium rubens (strain ATCC 28089 / DSM 1075 / NRRL 1951 / Wisconsin 54-1255) TaxID=500485 RepID=B6H4A3_PENRW|nr:uncharacterized protein N7525_003353 [Penicillium rubens]KAF3030707.1 hypothetical protein E8E15_010658 [Penicillium rubens]KAJ5838165.1 hypothetical protein N7525_003353 [Penicillium rubens]KAJ5866214.1 hypothetical protein N7534_000767 [Penicillium rubens]CAP91885.1 hypothetical protein PCH_Pc13g08160 [Penicillium rubens Wisconsin 54-1255]
MSINYSLGPRSDNYSSRTPVITIGAIAGSLIFLAMAGSLLYLFSRKERARRRNAQQSDDFSPLEPPPAYKTDELGTSRGLHSQPRPLSSFAPDYSRQAQHAQQYQQQLSRPSYDQPPAYPTLPTYDPSRYQPIRPTSMAGDINAHTHTYNPSNHANPHPGPSSRLSAVHYSDARLSTSRPVSMVGHGLLIGPVAAPTRSRHQAAMPPPPEQNSRQERRDRRERSVSEPIPSGQAAPKRPKPVLSRLITNFH